MSNHPAILHDETVRRAVIESIQALDLSRPWAVTIAPHRRRRTLNQNALMWAWLDQVEGYVGEYTGMDRDDIHEFLKSKFLPPRYVVIGGETKQVSPSTRKLNTAEMGEYMDRIHAWASTELGLRLPVPERAA